MINIGSKGNLYLTPTIGPVMAKKYTTKKNKNKNKLNSMLVPFLGIAFIIL